MAGKLKVVGVFSDSLCSVYVDGNFIAHAWNLRYTGVGSEGDNMRMYSNEKAHIWLDYAVYE